MFLTQRQNEAQVALKEGNKSRRRQGPSIADALRQTDWQRWLSTTVDTADGRKLVNEVTLEDVEWIIVDKEHRIAGLEAKKEFWIDIHGRLVETGAARVGELPEQ
jgi:hypothetical protein